MGSDHGSYDATQPRANIILVWTGVVMVAIMAIIGVSWYVFEYALTYSIRAAENHTHLPLDREAIMRYETQNLNRLRWRNQDHQTIQIPIDMAIELTHRLYR